MKSATQRCRVKIPKPGSLFLLAVLINLSVAAQDATYWQQQVNYRIDVSLDDKEHTLDGFVKMEYSNHSPDTLRFIWFHLWPNAFKNDKTAFSNQLLLNNRTDFYFSKKEERGYINRLDFKVNNITATTEDHPQYIDVIKLLLPQPLAPQQIITISTPFHIQLPKNFSRGGHTGESYQVTQWYPKPAVYDRKGWHPMPYLDQGEFYSEFGNYDVRITLPANYVVAATGVLQNEEEKKWLAQRTNYNWQPEDIVVETKPVSKYSRYKKTKKVKRYYPVSAAETKTLQYLQNNVHDFAWFADKRFIVQQETMLLAEGKPVLMSAFYLPGYKSSWSQSLDYIKKTITSRSKWIGVYPYETVTVVQGAQGFSGGMEYPTITIIDVDSTTAAVENVIEHEVGHNWFYGILGSNERLHPWMDEGMNSYYDKRYEKYYSNNKSSYTGNFASRKIPTDIEALTLAQLYVTKKDQPITTPSAAFTDYNYGMIAYAKTAQWMALLEKELGTTLFDSCMQQYYRQWQFKHPYPDDFKTTMEKTSGKNLDAIFSLLDKTGPLQTTAAKKKTKLTGLFNLKDTDTKKYISVLPVVGANAYDKLQAGVVIHNYQLPVSAFKFFVAPLYATGSKTLNGMARVEYTWQLKGLFRKIDAGVNAAKFSASEFAPEGKEKIHLGFRKLAPYIRLTLKENDPLSKQYRFIQFKNYLINEDGLEFKTVTTPADTFTTVNKVSSGRYLNQIKLVTGNDRSLYPYRGEVLLEQAEDFVRAAFTGNYYFNYADKKGGLNLRVFAGKFFYTGNKTITKQFATDRYHLNLTGADGFEDYTYSNYFVGRNKFEGAASQQIMMRDGGFKVRTNLLSDKIGKTDNWLAAANFTSTLPDNINPLSALPVSIPLRIFADIGTFAEAWQKDAGTSRFLFDAGLQVSLFHETVNIYIPLIYSKEFGDYFKSTLGEKRFWKQVSFSIDIQNLNLNRLQKTIPLEF